MRIDSLNVSTILCLMHIPLPNYNAISFTVVKPIDRILNQHKNFIISHL